MHPYDIICQSTFRPVIKFVHTELCMISKLCALTKSIHAKFACMSTTYHIIFDKKNLKDLIVKTCENFKKSNIAVLELNNEKGFWSNIQTY